MPPKLCFLCYLLFKNNRIPVMAKKKNTAPKCWPGMPTTRSQMFETLVMLFPVVLAIIGAVIALVLSLIH